MNPNPTDLETVTFRVPYGRDNDKNPFGDYSYLQLTISRPHGSQAGVMGKRQWSLVASPVGPHDDLLLTEEQAVGYLRNFFHQQSTSEKQPKQPDLLATVATNRWRLDCRHETGAYRVMYWCVSCGLWRPVVDSGQWFSDPAEAISQAILATVEPEERPEGRDGQAGLPGSPRGKESP